MTTGNEILVMFFSGTALLLLFALMLIVFMINQRQVRHQYYAEKQRLKDELNFARVQADQQVMSRVMTGIHDLILQNAISARMMIQLADQAEGKVKSDHIRQALLSLDELRRSADQIMHSLNTDYIKANSLDLIIGEELERIQASSNLTFDIRTEGDLDRLSPVKKLLVYRIIQNALEYILSHGMVSRIGIRLHCSYEVLQISIICNTCLCRKDRLHTVSDELLRYMEQQVKCLNGQLNINTDSSVNSSMNITIKDIS